MVTSDLADDSASPSVNAIPDAEGYGPSKSAGGWSKNRGQHAGDPALERRTLRAVPIFTPWNKLENWQIADMPRTPLV